ncbi:MAG: DUF669 domain-containing protein [Clostridia bacterium]|nr:DUF669 domain-containing protein [Clostridia bacterium]
MDERELDWNDNIENDGEAYQLLPEGDYDFEVIRFERGRSKGSDKLPPCNMAILTIQLSGGGLSTVVTENLVLHTKMEWKLSQFFCAIGQKQKGEKVRMNWQAVLGAKGRCKVGVRSYQKQNGEDGLTNEIKKFYEADMPSPPSPSTANAVRSAPKTGALAFAR